MKVPELLVRSAAVSLCTAVEATLLAVRSGENCSSYAAMSMPCTPMTVSAITRPSALFRDFLSFVAMWREAVALLWVGSNWFGKLQKA
jgi:hypothetical protein